MRGGRAALPPRAGRIFGVAKWNVTCSLGPLMKPRLRRPLAATVVFFASVALARAHPGHDGHDFTWDFGHLAAYPDATILCFGLLGLVVWGTWKIVRASAEAPKGVVVRVDEVRRDR